MARVIIASVNMACVLCNHYGKCTYGKCIMANEIEPFLVGNPADKSDFRYSHILNLNK